jgi:beta-galactosidase/beta-glucuronidase
MQFVLATNDRGYPRPQLERAHWICLNGLWDFAIDLEGDVDNPASVRWSTSIRVPYAPETAASGVCDTSLFKVCWYRRTIEPPIIPAGHRLLLHFGAVDCRATVWANGSPVAEHEGGYTPFTCDLTPLALGGAIEIVVRAEDDPADLAKPRGKQDWLREPHSIWYERTSGIWQTVWMEVVPPCWIGAIRWTTSLDRWEVACAVRISGVRPDNLRLAIRLHARGQLLADDHYLVVGGEVHRRIALSDPGIDDYRNALLWNPASPTLIHAELRLIGQDDTVIDAARSYTALRSVAVEGDRFVLNGRPYQLRLVLDQGYWPDSGLTAPNDEGLRRDVELAKAMGFNGVRKHQKIEDPRYLYWADTLGLLVWAEMPSAYRFTQESIDRTTREWIAVITRDYSHPCIVAWVPFNESWGVPNLPNNPAERHYVRALYHLTKTLDSTRPVVGNDGWESIATDMIGIHDYDADPDRLARRYHADEVEPRFFRRERPGGRLLLLERERHANEPIILSEFGGISLSKNGTSAWGYSRVESSRALKEKYTALLTAVRSIGLLSGFCYTQFADTYQEANGLLYADRTPKVPLDAIAAATTGVPTRRTR